MIDQQSDYVSFCLKASLGEAESRGVESLGTIQCLFLARVWNGALVYWSLFSKQAYCYERTGIYISLKQAPSVPLSSLTSLQWSVINVPTLLSWTSLNEIEI